MCISALIDNAKQFQKANFPSSTPIKYIWHFQLNKPYQYFVLSVSLNLVPLAADLAGIYLHQSKKFKSPHDYDHNRERTNYFSFVCMNVCLSFCFIYQSKQSFQIFKNDSVKAIKETLLINIISGIPLDIIHGVSTAVFILLLGRPLIRRIHRIKYKYEI